MRRQVEQTHPDAVLARLSGRGHGVLARERLLDAGLTAGQIQRRLDSGRLVALHRGVYAVGGLPLTPVARALAGVLACGSGSSLSHLHASWLWNLLPHPDGPVHVTRARPAARRPGVRVHRARLRRADVTIWKGIPVTTAARTLVDIAPLVPRRRLERALDEAAYLGRLPGGTLAATLSRNAGRRGVPTLRAVLAEHTPGSTRTRSELEELFLRLCRVHTLPRPLVNAHVAGLEVDFLWPLERVVVETDGYASHSRRSTFERDHERDLRLEEAGYAVRRFTYRQITRNAAAVAASVRRALG